MRNVKRKDLSESGGNCLTRIKVQGFKSLVRPSEVEVRPLTILAGANNSGKSSIMQPLLLLKQTLEAPYDPGALKIDGPIVNFTSPDQIFSRTAGKKISEELFVELEKQNDENKAEILSFVFFEAASKKIDIDRMIFQSTGEPIPFLADRSTPKNSAPLDEAVRIVGSPYKSVRGGVEKDRFFLVGDYTFVFPGGKTKDVYLNYSEDFKKILSRVIYVPGARGTPSRDYPTASLSGPSFKGLFLYYFAQLIETWQGGDPILLGRLNDLLMDLKLASEVQARMVNGARIELKAVIGPKPSKGRRPVARNLADVGFGVSQVLPVLTALLVAEPGQIVYLEEPELHLHPRAQVAMAGVLVAAAKRGVLVVAETHSSLLLLAIQTLVAEKKLDPELVKLHWFSLGRDGSTKIKSADLDENGAFGDWPEDFGEVELKTESRYLDAVEGKKK